jgi:predicted MFS family arabinose efflux permease
MAVIGANSLVLPPIAPAVAISLATDVSSVLQAAAAYGGGTIFAALFLAPRADVIGLDRALRISCCLLIFALSLSCFAPTVGILFVGQALGGLGAGAALPTIYSIAAQIAPKGRRKQTIGFVLSGWTFSLIGGVTLSAMLADFLSWRVVYGLLAAMTVLIWALLMRSNFGSPVDEKPEFSVSPFLALRTPGILRGLGSNAMLMLAFNGAYLYLGSHIVENMGLSTTAAGIMTMFYGFGFGLASLLNRHLELISMKRLGVLAFAGLTVSYLLMELSVLNFVLLLPIALIWGIFQHFGLNLVVERLTSLDPYRRGAIMGLNSAVTYSTVLGGAILYRIPYEYGGLGACLAFSAVFAVLGCLEAFWPNAIKTYSAAE